MRKSRCTLVLVFLCNVTYNHNFLTAVLFNIPDNNLIVISRGYDCAFAVFVKTPYLSVIVRVHDLFLLTRFHATVVDCSISASDKDVAVHVVNRSNHTVKLEFLCTSEVRAIMNQDLSVFASCEKHVVNASDRADVTFVSVYSLIKTVAFPNADLTISSTRVESSVLIRTTYVMTQR